MICSVCHKKKRTVQMSLSAHTLIFGGLRNVFYVPRCQACETKLAKRIEKMIK